MPAVAVCSAPAPGEPPFVKVGDRVKKGQTVCIIEAMKLMNEIEVRDRCFAQLAGFRVS
jgi:biotin carboxyl carrier protein